MDSSEYKHVVLGLVFLKYVSDKFNEKYAQLLKEDDGYFAEDKDEYLGENIIFVPPHARWQYIAQKAHEADIGKYLDEAMTLIEKSEPRLKNVLPKNYASPDLDHRRLGDVVDLFTNVRVAENGTGKDVLGRVYEYFLSQFASAEGKKGGEFYTPSSITRLLVEMIEPYKGRIYDPCCGSAGLFIQSGKFIEAHGGNLTNISIYGQESNATTWKLAKMNLAIHGLDTNLGEKNADTFSNDLHKNLKAQYILANPPFNLKDWGGEHLKDDPRWKYGLPPVNNANYAWISHMISKLAPEGRAGFVLANGSLSTQASGEGEIRKNILKDDVVDCIVAMPTKLFYSTQIPVSLWFLSRKKTRPGEVLFIDARKIGHMEDRIHRTFSDEDIARIAGTYHAWRDNKDYEDEAGFSKSATLDEIQEKGWKLTPGPYVGSSEEEDDGEPFDEKMKRLTAELGEMFEKSHELEEEIRENLKAIGYEF